MAKVGSMFPGSYLKAADLNGRRIMVTIEEVKFEDIGGDTKPVVHFVGKDRGLVLNKTNASMITEVVGSDESDDWTGHQIVIYPSKTDFQGKRVDCIRVDYPPKGQAKPVQRQAEPEPAFQAGDEDVPF